MTLLRRFLITHSHGLDGLFGVGQDDLVKSHFVGYDARDEICRG